VTLEDSVPTQRINSISTLNSPMLIPSLVVLLGSSNVKVSVESLTTAIERAEALAPLGETAAEGDTEVAEEAAHPLPVVGKTVGAIAVEAPA